MYYMRFLPKNKPSKSLMNKLNLLGFRVNHMFPTCINISDEKVIEKKRSKITRNPYCCFSDRFPCLWDQIDHFIRLLGYQIYVEPQYKDGKYGKEIDGYKYRYIVHDTADQIKKDVNDETLYKTKDETYVEGLKVVIDDALAVMIQNAQRLIEATTKKKRTPKKKTA